MKWALICSGQGTQHPGMTAMIDGRSEAERVFGAFTDVLGTDPRASLGRREERYENGSAQPLLCAHALACWSELEAEVVAPTLVMGYSVGELAAYGCAGALDAGTLALLSRVRAMHMDAAAPPGMGLLSIRGNSLDIEGFAAAHALEAAIVLTPEWTIFAAPTSLVESARAEAARARVTVTALKVNVPSHTSHLHAAVAPFEEELGQYLARAPRIPVVAGVSGRAVRAASQAASTLASQLSRPVRWDLCMQAAREAGCRVFFELGPGRALAQLAREHWPGVEARSLEEFSSLEGSLRWLRARTAAG